MTPSLFCFFVASVIGTRLHVPVALTCILMAFYLLFLRWWRMAKFCVFFMIYHQKLNSLCWEWRNWETIFIWSAYYLCTYSECEGKSHCKYVLLCNLYCNYMNRCNNVALTIIIFGGKDWPLDKKKTWYGFKFIYWSYCIYCNNKHVPITTVHILCMMMLQIKGNQLRQLLLNIQHSIKEICYILRI